VAVIDIPPLVYAKSSFSTVAGLHMLIVFRVVKTAHSFSPANHDEKDRLTAYAAPSAVVPQAFLFAGCPSFTAVGLSAVTAVALCIL